MPVAHGDVEDELFFPAQEGVAHQAGDVVGDRAVHRILEVEHTQVAVGVNHQIARHEVAMHINACAVQRIEVAGLDLRKQRIELGDERAIQRKPPVLADIPLGKQCQLARQQRVVVRRQHARFGGELPLHQHVDGLHIKIKMRRRGLHAGIDSGGWRDHVHHGLCAQVGQQHEAQRRIPGQHARRFEAGVRHQAGHLDERRAVFLRGRRVHDDEALAARGVHTEIAAKAGIGRCQPDSICL